MPNAFMVSSLFTAIACVAVSGFAAWSFVAQSDECFDKPTACLGESVTRSRSAVTQVVNNWE